MKHIVYIIGHRSGDPFRIRNLLLTTRWLNNIKKRLENTIKLTIVVVEQDSKPTINQILGEHIDYLFIYNAGQYNRGWAFNVGFIEYEFADYFYFADNDIIMDNDAIVNVFETCFEYNAVNPYSSIYDTKSETFETCKEIKFLFSNLEKHSHIKGKRENTCFTGGIVGLSRNAVHKLSGWDERFRGRGWEDYALTCKINLFLKSVHIFDNNAVHLWHPWDVCSDRTYNHDINELYCKYKVDDYINLIKHTTDSIGCINKYINEDCENEYLSDEHDVNIKYQKCNHCKKIDRQCYKKHDYSGAYKIYDELYELVNHKHKDITINQLRMIIFYNLCKQHECELHHKCNGSINFDNITS